MPDKAPKDEPFRPEVYWEKRLSGMYRKEGVGYQGLGEGFNYWFYRVAARVFRRTVVKCLGKDLRGLDVLDVGFGTGFYLEQWKRLGVRSITGVDITEVAVRKMQEQHPDVHLLQMDIGDSTVPLEEDSFDILSAMGVLFHIVDDARYENALRNVAMLLRPGGTFIYSDNFLHGSRYEARHQVCRTLPEIETQVERVGLEVVARTPMYFLMNSPVDSGSRVLHFLWRLEQRLSRLHSSSSYMVGATLYPWELILTRVCRESPSQEIMVCRKPLREN